MYQYTKESFTGATSTQFVLRIADGAFIPSDVKNADYRAYTKWVAAGNTPGAASA